PAEARDANGGIESFEGADQIRAVKVAARFTRADEYVHGVLPNSVWECEGSRCGKNSKRQYGASGREPSGCGLHLCTAPLRSRLGQTLQGQVVAAVGVGTAPEDLPGKAVGSATRRYPNERITSSTSLHVGNGRRFSRLYRSMAFMNSVSSSL